MALVVTYSDGNLLFTDTGTQTLTNSVSLSPNDIIENKTNGDVVIVGNDNGEVKAKFNRYTELNPPLVAPALFTTKPLPLPVSVVSSTPSATEVASATWGYDDTGVLFYVKQKSDGTIVYESPIGALATPTGDVSSFRTTAQTSTLNVIETNASGSVPSCLAWQIINTGGGALTLNGVSIASGAAEHTYSMEGKTLPNEGVYVYAPAFTYDATSTSVTIIYQTYP